MNKKILLIFIFSLFLTLRIIPYINDAVPTGYDAGIYLHVIKSFPGIPNWLISQYYSFLLFLTWALTIAGLQPETFIVPFALLIQVFFFISVFLAAKRLIGLKEALLAVLLLSVSAIQIRAYWFFYLKYILSIAFLISYLSYLGKKSYLKTVIFGVLTMTTHLLTGGILFFTALIDAALTKGERLRKSILLFVILFFCLLFNLPFYNQTIITNLKPTLLNSISLDFQEKDMGGGTFYPIPLSLLLAGIYLPLSLFGIWKTRKAKNLMPLLITLAITLILITIKASMFRRIFIITDIILIIYAALGFSLVKDIKKFYIIALIIFGLLFTVKTGDKLILQKGLDEITEFNPLINGSYLLSTSKEDTSWLLGYTSSKVIAWDYGGYDKFWSKNQWEGFLTKNYPVEEKAKLLGMLPKPTYLYINDKTKKRLGDILERGYVQQLSAHLWKIK